MNVYRCIVGLLCSLPFLSANANELILGDVTAGGPPDQYIVIFDRAAIPLGTESVATNAAALAAAHGAEILNVYRNVLGGFNARMPESAARNLARSPLVKAVVREGFVWPSQSQSSPDWGLDRIDQRRLPLNSTFGYESTGQHVRIYVIDSGVRPTHSDFGGRVFLRADFVGGDGHDCYGHGTHVAGLAAGAIHGVAKSAEIHSIRVFDCSGNESPMGAVISALEWLEPDIQNAQASGIRSVVNMSMWSLPDLGFDTAVRDIVVNRDVQVVYSAGNSGGDACNLSPNVPEAIAVGATTSTDARWSDSSYGSCVDVFAPGHYVSSTWHTSDSATNIQSGTSMAAPIVAGRIAQLLQGPNLGAAAIKLRVANYHPTFGVLSNIGTGSPNRMVYSLTEIYRPNISLFFSECASGQAIYNFYSLGDYGPEDESYVREIQFSGWSSWQVVGSGTGQFSVLSVGSHDIFRVRARYTVSLGTSADHVTEWVTAPNCAGGIDP